MLKRHPRISRVCGLFLFIFWVSQVEAASEPAFWSVTKGKATVYLLGSVHFGHEDFYPLPAEIETAYKRSSKLVVEVNVADITPDKASTAINRYGRLPLGKTLSAQMSPRAYTKLVKYGEESHLPISEFEKFEPWLVAVQIVEVEIAKMQLNKDLGIDMHFLKKAIKPVEELETLDQQLSLFGNLKFSEQEVFLTQTLDDLAKGESYLNAMAEAWKKGDVQTLETTLLDPFRESPDTKNLFKKVFTERNDKMAAAVNQYLAEGRNVFLVVGIGHMLGEEGMIAQLKKQGLTVERVQFVSHSKK